MYKYNILLLRNSQADKFKPLYFVVLKSKIEKKYGRNSSGWYSLEYESGNI